MKYSICSTLRFATLAALAVCVSTQAWAQNGRISTVAISAGAVTLTERTAANVNPPITNTNQPVYVGDNLAGLTFFNGNPGIDGTPTNASVGSPTSAALFTLTGALIPGGAGTDLHAFMGYGTIVGPPTQAATYNDVAPLLAANTTYAGLTFAEPNLYPGGPAPLKANTFYTIHHATNGTDYISAIVPFTGGGSQVMDIKPMSWPGGVAGGPASLGNPGYFALTFAEPTPTGPYFANLFYYLRTDTSNNTQFGYVIPALVSGSLDTLNLSTAAGSFGVGGYTTLAFSPTAFGGYAASQFYYLRQDTGIGGTGNTILGRLDTTPGNRTISDIANLGGVYNTLTYVLNALGTAPAWGSSQLVVAGAPRVAGAQSISFAAIPDHNVGDVFTITPTASSGLDLDVTVVSGPATIQTTGVSGAVPTSLRVFTITTTGPGVVKLQARQAGSVAPLFVANMLQQSFNVVGLPTITSATTAPGTVGTPFTYTITATGDPHTSYAATGLPASLTLNTTTGAISGTPLVAAVINASVTATNATGTSVASPVTITVAAAGVTPIITNSPLTAGGTVGTPFSFTITASGTPTSYSASPLPAGLAINTATGAITGTPTTAATTPILLGATNGTGTGNATLTVTIGAAGVAPIITNSPLTAAGTVGVPFSFSITASGSPTSYTAAPIPAGLVLNAATGIITGTPTTVATTPILLGATNGTGTGNATLTVTIGAAGVAPIITNSPLTAAGTVGTPFSFTITASGSPTSHTAVPLPAGLSIVPATGVITGTPTTVGSTPVLLGATNGTGTGNATLTITVAAAGVAPIITNNPLTAGATVGTPFGFAITASGLPTSYSATGLPSGLSIVPATGVITGTPSSSGTFIVALGATNGTGTGNATLTITVSAASNPPSITNGPPTAAGTVGIPFSFAITATDDPTSYSATGLPAGLIINTATGTITGTPVATGVSVVALQATNSFGTGTMTLTITVAVPTVAPIITSPTTAVGNAGTPFVTYLIGATGLPTSYTATGLPPGLTLNPLTGAINGTPTTPGTYVVTLEATNTAGTSTVTLTMEIATRLSSRIANFSARALSGPGSDTLIVGFVVAGFGQNLLVRAVGPSLSQSGVTNTLANPVLTLRGPNGVIATNDDWQTNSSGVLDGVALAATAAQVGAFALPAGSKDSALLVTLNSGAHTTSLGGLTPTTGVVLTEIYEVSSPLGAQLMNVSARMNVTAGEGTLIAGVVIAGNTPKAILIRGVGPSLAAFGVPGLLADPTIAVYRSGTLVASNDNWETGTSTAAQMSETSARVGAFALSAGSKDAALLLTLAPGAYTVHVTGVGNTTGVALVELYDAQ